MLKKNIILFALSILLIFALLTYQSVKGERLLPYFTLYPLKLLEQGGSSLLSLFDHIPFIGKSAEERSLLDRLNRCEEERTKYKEAAYENERLRGLLDLKSQRPDYVAAAEVFAREPTNWFQILWINKGTVNRVAKDMVAVTPLGLVGRIHRVFNERANVILVTDVNSSVAVRLESSRVEGILEGNGEDRCYLKYVSKEVEVEADENVITSGLDGIFPEGLLVGFVSSVDREGGDLFQRIEVTPSQNLNKIEEVVILKK
jgi:rod shape-determining protein MreC